MNWEMIGLKKGAGMVALLLAFMLFLTPNTTTYAAFKDVPSVHWAASDIDRLVKMGAIQGFDDGTYRLNDGVTRAQAAKIIVESVGFSKKEPATASFKDVKKEQWFYPYVETLAAYNIIGGYEDGTFRPNEKLTRGQMASIISSSFNLKEESGYRFKDVSDASWYKVYVDRLATANITKGYEDGTFKPGLTVSRAHIAAFIIRGVDHRDEMNEVFSNSLGLTDTKGDLDAVSYSVHQVSKNGEFVTVYVVAGEGQHSYESMGALGKGLESEILKLNKGTGKVFVRFYTSDSDYNQRKVKAVYRDGAVHYN